MDGLRLLDGEIVGVVQGEVGDRGSVKLSAHDDP